MVAPVAPQPGSEAGVSESASGSHGRVTAAFLDSEQLRAGVGAPAQAPSCGLASTAAAASLSSMVGPTGDSDASGTELTRRAGPGSLRPLALTELQIGANLPFGFMLLALSRRVFYEVISRATSLAPRRSWQVLRKVLVVLVVGCGQQRDLMRPRVVLRCVRPLHTLDLERRVRR